MSLLYWSFEYTLKSQRFEEESTLLADNKLTSKLDGSCAVHAPECEELQRLGAEGLVAIRDINKLPNDSDSLELFKETLPSPIMMQVQSDNYDPVMMRVQKLIRVFTRCWKSHLHDRGCGVFVSTGTG